jgi:hypothetical protein
VIVTGAVNAARVAELESAAAYHPPLAVPLTTMSEPPGRQFKTTPNVNAFTYAARLHQHNAATIEMSQLGPLPTVMNLSRALLDDCRRRNSS